MKIKLELVQDGPYGIEYNINPEESQKTLEQLKARFTYTMGTLLASHVKALLNLEEAPKKLLFTVSPLKGSTRIFLRECFIDFIGHSTLGLQSKYDAVCSYGSFDTQLQSLNINLFYLTPINED